MKGALTRRTLLASVDDGPPLTSIGRPDRTRQASILQKHATRSSNRPTVEGAPAL
jgi:hypothetical protein